LHLKLHNQIFLHTYKRSPVLLAKADRKIQTFISLRASRRAGWDISAQSDYKHWITIQTAEREQSEEKSMVP
jgi:hypothetical protein